MTVVDPPIASECAASSTSGDSLAEPPAEHWSVGNRVVAILAGFMLFVGIASTVTRAVKQYQVPGPFTPDRQGYCDFHNGIYFPTRAVLAGESPYSDAYAAKYPVARQIPFFSPVILLLHAPLVVLPLHLAEGLNTILQIVMIFAIAAVSAHQAGYRKRWDALLVVAAVMIFTRGGHITLFNGYFTFQVVLATLLAVIWADRHPVRSAWMLFIVSAKPTYILPLGFLMLARGNFRALVIGAALSIAGAVLSLGWLAYHEGGGDLSAGVSILQQQIVDTQAVHRSMEDESPVFSWTRLDLFAIVAKWSGDDPGDLPHLLVMFVLLVVPCWVLFQRSRRGVDDGIGGVTGALLLTTLLVSLYHQSYDSLLLVAPIAGAVGARLAGWQRMKPIWKWSLVALMTWPAINYLSTRTFLLRFDLPEPAVKVFTSLSGISLAMAMVVLVVVTWRSGRQATG